MKLTISGQHMKTGESLRTQCEDRMLGLKKYFEHVIDVHITFRPEVEGIESELAVQANGTHLRALGTGSDAYVALNDAATKMERQLQRYKGRMNKALHHAPSREAKLLKLAKMEATSTTVEKTELDALAEGAEWLSEVMPVVKHKEVKNIVPMTVDEAIMQMDLLHKPAFLFQNTHTGQLNVVYREGDGAVKWIEPKVQAAA